MRSGVSGRGTLSCWCTGLAAGLLVGALGCGGGGTEPSLVAPVLSLIAPASVPVNTDGFRLTVVGSGFSVASVVRWNGQDRPTAYVDSTRLTAEVYGVDVDSVGTAQITVFTPGAGTSQSLTLGIGQAGSNPLSVTSVDPASGIAGGPAETITVTGSGFVPGTEVQLDYVFTLATTFVSPTRLTAVVPESLLSSNRTRGVRATFQSVDYSPDSVAWETRALVPTLSAIAPAQAVVGQPALDVQVTGTGFVRSSVVLAGSDTLTTRYVSRTELTATIPESLLATPGTRGLQVSTPPPGGGVSATATLTVAEPSPTMFPLPVLGVTAGRSGFNLEVQGDLFPAGSDVEWNGTPLPTTYGSARRLIATVPGSDVASPGVAQITVRLPGGTVTAPQTLTIYPQPVSAISDQHVVALPARDLAWDGAHGLLYASAPASAGSDGNSIVAIDPTTGTITAASFVGSDPSDIELSHDGQLLYVALDGPGSVRRMSVPDLTPGLEFSVGAERAVDELHVMPTDAHVVAVSRLDPLLSPSGAGIAIYDDGVARPQVSEGYQGGNTFGWTDDGTTIYGYGPETSDFSVSRFNVTTSGVRLDRKTGGLISGYGVRVQVVGNLLYSANGAVVDGELEQRLGSCDMSGALTIDRALGRVFYWDGTTVQVCDIQSFQALGAITVAGSGNPVTPLALVRWGTDGLAMTDGTAVYLVRTPLAGP